MCNISLCFKALDKFWPLVCSDKYQNSVGFVLKWQGSSSQLGTGGFSPMILLYFNYGNVKKHLSGIL